MVNCFEHLRSGEPGPAIAPNTRIIEQVFKFQTNRLDDLMDAAAGTADH